MTLPQRIGPYRPLHQIGAGGMGTVYFAYHPVSGQPSAIKVLSSAYATDQQYRQRFAREVEVLRKVSGPYLIPLTDADTAADIPWLTMPYVRGETLQQHVQAHGPLRGENLLTFAAAVALALAYIHAAGVTHRDLKHANVILAEDGPRVLDFGIAGHVDATAFTRTSLPRSGSLGWMAPEQLTLGKTTPACDIFAWGLLVAYAAAAAHPFGLPTAIDHRIVHAKPDLGAVPDRLRRLVLRALRKDPAARPSAALLAEQSADLLGPEGTVVFPTVAYTRQAPSTTAEDSALTHNLPWSIADPGIDLTKALPFTRTEGWRIRSETQDFLNDATATLAHLRETLDRTKPARVDTSDARAALGVADTALATVREQYDRAGAADCEPASRAVDAATVATADVLATLAEQQAAHREPGRPVPSSRGRRKAFVAAVAAVALAGSAAYAMGRSANPAGGQRPRAAATTPSAEKSAAPTPATVAPTSSSPSPTDTTTTVPPVHPAAPVTLFGGLKLTLPSSWSTLPVPQDSLNFDDGMDSKYAVDLVPAGASGTGGLAVEWAPGMTTIKGGANGSENDNFGMFDTRFSTGGPNPSAGGTYEFNGDVRPQTVTHASAMKQVSVANEDAQAWTVQTDILPDHNHKRTAVHRVWFLPSSHYVLYDYGTLEPKRAAEIEAIVRSAKITAMDIPLDCLDAVDLLDTSAAGGDLEGDDPSQSCLDMTVNSAGSGDTSSFENALDPGTAKTKTAAACLSLVSEYSISYVQGDSGYTRVRRNCDFPRKPLA
ncbi:serine/threonine protein kinase [Streptomyces sp. NBC_00841]|uniref:serine/threonine-protein kinase n=1 Tax=Streptomyces sp. NBC_00841 TaxID=2975847 RepID=UPI002DD9E862|nr:serine/threonine-protein kinase [Streptomyces sp. NBC_00841]WRZ97039.1 serine/threonine protein kinase [Streptomyces sp. NBC_00841]